MYFFQSKDISYQIHHYMIYVNSTIDDYMFFINFLDKCSSTSAIGLPYTIIIAIIVSYMFSVIFKTNGLHVIQHEQRVCLPKT